MATKRDILLRLTGDPSDAHRAIKGVEGDVKHLDRQSADVRVDIKTAGLNAKLDKLNGRLNRLGSQVQTPEIKIRTAGVLGQIEKVERELGKLHDKHVDITGGGGGGGAGAAGAAGGLASRAAGGFAAAGGAAVVGVFGKRALENASDVNEALSKNKVLFGDSAKTIEKFAETSARKFGLSKKDALDAAGAFGAFAKSAGKNSEDAAKFGVTLAQRAADLASFSNTTTQEAVDSILSGLSGESEPLRKYNSFLTDQRLRQQAFHDGLIKTTKEALTPQTKILAAYNLLLEDTAPAQGDVERTSHGFANQTRILSAELTDLEAAIGEKVLPTITDLIEILTGALRGDFSKLAHGLKNLVIDQLKLIIGAIKLYTLPYRKAGQALGHALANGIKAGFHAVIHFVEKRVQNLIDAFNALPGPDIPDIIHPRKAEGKAGDSLQRFGEALTEKIGPRGRRPAGRGHRPTAGDKQARISNNFNIVAPPAQLPDPTWMASKLGRLLEARGLG